MPTNLDPETPADEIRRLQARGLSPVRILTAMGHPGYGRRFAAERIAIVLRYEHVGYTMHDAIYGGIGAERKRLQFAPA